MQVLELIHRYLLESGFPKASIVSDFDAGNGQQNFRPSYTIIDPETCERLAVIDVVPSGERKDLADRSLHVLRYLNPMNTHPAAARLQGFIIQVDVDEPDETQQVRFFKLHSSKQMEQLSSYAFPDLDALRVSQKMEQASRVVEMEEHTPVAPESSNKPGVLSKLPIILAVLLVLFALVDLYLMMTIGRGLFSVQQTLLVVAAALIFVIPSLQTKLRR